MWSYHFEHCLKVKYRMRLQQFALKNEMCLIIYGFCSNVNKFRWDFDIQNPVNIVFKKHMLILQSIGVVRNQFDSFIYSGWALETWASFIMLTKWQCDSRFVHAYGIRCSIIVTNIHTLKQLKRSWRAKIQASLL